MTCSDRSPLADSLAEPLLAGSMLHHRCDWLSNPFATRFTRPGALTYRFCPVDRADLPAIGDQTEAGKPSSAAIDPGDGGSPSDHGPSIDRLVRGVMEKRFGLIVGPHGTGKSTLLHTLTPAFRERFSEVQSIRLDGCPTGGVRERWRHARRVGRQVMSVASQAGRGALIVVDGIEQVLPWQRRRLLWGCRRRHQVVLATSHRSLPGLHVLYETRIHANLIEQLIDQLLDQASPEVEALVRAELERRDLDRVGNLRDFWFELYDVVQPSLISTLVPQRSNTLHGRPIVRRHDSISSTLGRCRSDV